MSYINTQATSSYREALQATENIEAPAVGFCRPSEYRGPTTGFAASLKQGNTQIQLLVTILEKLDNLEERLKKLKARPTTAAPTSLPDEVIQNLTDKIKSLNLQEKLPEKKGKLRVFKDPYKILEEAKSRK